MRQPFVLQVAIASAVVEVAILEVMGSCFLPHLIAFIIFDV